MDIKKGDMIAYRRGGKILYGIVFRMHTQNTVELISFGINKHSKRVFLHDVVARIKVKSHQCK